MGFLTVPRGLILALIAVVVAAGSPARLFAEDQHKSLEQLRKQVLHRRTFITFADGSTATVRIQQIHPDSLSLTILQTSNNQLHPPGMQKQPVTIASIAKLMFHQRENLGGRLFRTTLATALSAGILTRCTWRSEAFEVFFTGVVNSQSQLLVRPFNEPGCDS